jgi:hypothetical protein
VANPTIALPIRRKVPPYAYRVTARFDGSQGTGSRVQGGDCSFTFVKQ